MAEEEVLFWDDDPLSIIIFSLIIEKSSVEETRN